MTPDPAPAPAVVDARFCPSRPKSSECDGVASMRRVSADQQQPQDLNPDGDTYSFCLVFLRRSEYNGINFLSATKGWNGPTTQEWQDRPSHIKPTELSLGLPLPSIRD